MFFQECIVDYSSVKMTNSDILGCTLFDTLWSMELECLDDKIWNDTLLPRRSMQCSCDGGEWQTVREENGRQ